MSAITFVLSATTCGGCGQPLKPDPLFSEGCEFRTARGVRLTVWFCCVQCCFWGGVKHAREGAPTTVKAFRRLFGKAVIVLGLLLVACGSPFELSSPGVSELAGAPSRAGSIGDAGSTELGGGAAGTPTGGAPSGGGAPGAAGAGDDGGGAGAPEPVAAPCSRSGWGATASTSGEGLPPAAALDGSQATRWATGTEQAPGQWFELELGAGATLELVTLAAGQWKADFPLELGARLDGSPAPAELEHLVDGSIVLHFTEPRRAQVLLLELELEQAGSWWSIAELTAVCR